MKAIFNPGNAYAKLLIEGQSRPIVVPSGVLRVGGGEHGAFSLRRPVGRPKGAIDYSSPWVLSSHGDLPWHDDSGEGKAGFALPLLISAAWDYLPAESTIELQCLVHDPARLVDGLKANLNGRHVALNKGVEKAIDIEVVGTYREGIGVIKQLPQTGSAIVLDFGGNTIIATRYNDRRPDTTPAAAPAVLCGWGSSGLTNHIQTEGGKLVSFPATAEKCDRWLRSCSDDVAIAFLKGYFDQVRSLLARKHPGIVQDVSKIIAVGGLMRSKGCAAAVRQVWPGITIASNPQIADVLGLASRW